MIHRAWLTGTLLTAVALWGILPGAGALSAQTSPAYFVLLIGNDTVAVETYSRTEDSLTGRQVLRTPRTTIRDYTATLDENGHASRVEILISRPGEAAPITRADIQFQEDTAEVTVRQGDSTRVMRVPAARGAIPFLGYSVGLYELPIAHYLAGGAASTSLPLLPIGSPTAYEITISGSGGGWLTVSNIAGENRVRVDAEGRLLEWDGTGSTLKIEGERLANLDFQALADDFAERERAGQALGNLSPADSVMATIEGANVRIGYSRPSRRGRTIAGGVVPWDEVWRTGANQATVLTTDQDLVIGETTVPAGSYSLFTIPGQDAWTLIVNRQTGQWGTEHDPEQDLARIPMRSASATSGPEQFTIELEPDGDGGRLSLRWHDVDVWVPVRPAR